MPTHYLTGIRMSGRKSRYTAYYQAVPWWETPESALTRIVTAVRFDAKGRVMPCTEREISELWHYRHSAKRIKPMAGEYTND